MQDAEITDNVKIITEYMGTTDSHTNDYSEVSVIESSAVLYDLPLVSYLTEVYTG